MQMEDKQLQSVPPEPVDIDRTELANYLTASMQNDLRYRVKVYMDKHKLSKAEMLVKLGITRRNMSRILNGTFNGKISEHVSLMHAIGEVLTINYIPLKDLLEPSSPNHPPTPEAMTTETSAQMELAPEFESLRINFPKGTEIANAMTESRESIYRLQNTVEGIANFLDYSQFNDEQGLIEGYGEAMCHLEELYERLGNINDALVELGDRYMDEQPSQDDSE